MEIECRKRYIEIFNNRPELTALLRPKLNHPRYDMLYTRCFLPACFLLLIGLAYFGSTVSTSSSLARPPAKTSPGEDMTKAAQGFLKTLNKKQLETTVYSYDAKERTGWHFIPKDSRKGMQFKNMNADQRAAATNLLQTCLSQSGFKKAKTIMQLEGLLQAIEKGRGAIRDPERYYYTVFGQPDEKSKWGLSIEGHHLSLNFVVEENQLVSVSPSFFAANPGIVKTDIYDQIKKGTRVLKAEEALAFKLVNSLTAEQKKEAIFAAKAPKEIRAAGEPQPPQATDEGIEVKMLSAEQKGTLKKLMNAYLKNFRVSVAAEKMKTIEKNGLDNVRFAWGGATKPGIGHYYRIQGKSFLIEFVNTQPDAQGNPANHIHCVWRNPNGDFAIELIK